MSAAKTKRTASQQFAEDQLAAIEHHDGKLYIMAGDWGTWRDQWFITSACAADEAASRLADDGVLRIEHRPSRIVVERTRR